LFLVKGLVHSKKLVKGLVHSKKQ